MFRQKNKNSVENCKNKVRENSIEGEGCLSGIVTEKDLTISHEATKTGRN